MNGCRRCHETCLPTVLHTLSNHARDCWTNWLDAGADDVATGGAGVDQPAEPATRGTVRTTGLSRNRWWR